MKLTCDLCGGTLQMNLNGQGATCTNCGLTYPIERLREMLNNKAPDKTPVEDTPAEPKAAPPRQEQDVPAQRGYDEPFTVAAQETAKALTERRFSFRPEQFVMENSGNVRELCGQVLQGGIGLGDTIYLDGDPYTVDYINNDPKQSCVKAGMEASIRLPGCIKRTLKKAKSVVGDENPVANAYNYPGTVHAYFSHLLSDAFGEYEIWETVTREEAEMPVDYLLCKNSKPVLAIFLLNSNDDKRRRRVSWAQRNFAPKGIACTHFYDNYRNDAPYVIDRVQKALG